MNIRKAEKIRTFLYVVCLGLFTACQPQTVKENKSQSGENTKIQDNNTISQEKKGIYLRL